MERYLEQLIEELGKAEADPTPQNDFGDNYEEFEKMMHKIESGEKIPSKRILNVSYEELPPVERLTTEQVQRLLDAILNALSAKGTDVSIPGDNVPVELVYTEIREMFKEGFNAFPGWVIDFCSGCCPECAFVDYCDSSKEIWTEEDMEKERNSSRNAE